MRQTRNLFWGNPTGVRIPPSPFQLALLALDLFKVHLLTQLRFFKLSVVKWG
jgi:hypothetical protein